mgnify:CR=1 FL=1
MSVLFQGSFNYSFSVNGTGIEPFKSQFQPLHQKRWTLERYLNGEAIEFPRLTSNPSTVNSAAAYMSDFWLIDAWYIRLKTIDVSYQVPTKCCLHGLQTSVSTSMLTICLHGQVLISINKTRKSSPTPPVMHT